MAENKAHTNDKILEIFQSRISNLSADTAFKYRKTFSDFDSFITSHKLSFAEIAESNISDWVVELLRQGLSLATVIQRLNILNSLFKAVVQNGITCYQHEPRDIVKKFESQEFVLPPLLNSSTFDKSLTLIRRFAKDAQGHNIYTDILIFSLLNGAKALEEIIYLTKEDLPNYKGLSRTILERNVESRRKFVFNLKQSYQTSRQIAISITEQLKRYFGHILFADNYTFDDLSGSLWVAFAMRCGATASDALKCIKNSAQLSVPNFCTTSDCASENRNLWLNAVELLLTHELPKWYAMRLRRGIRFDEFRKEVSDRIRPVPELFYPVETIKKNLRGKTTVVEQPFISQTVFFKSYPENVLPMFAEIGDKAWCIKVSNNTDAPYAIIPQNEMQRFQRAIGVFSADAELYPLGSLTPKPGEAVILIQAGYSNRKAEVEEVLESNCGTALIRVKLTTDHGYEWRTTVDARQIERIVKAD